MSNQVCHPTLNTDYCILFTLHFSCLYILLLLFLSFYLSSFFSIFFFFFSSRRRHTRLQGDWSSDVCSSDLNLRSGLAELPVDADQVRRHPVPVVVRLHSRPPGGADASTERLVAEQPDGRSGHRRRIVGLHEKPGLTLADRLGDPPGARANDGEAGGRRFHDGD